MENTKYIDLIGRHLSGGITAGEKAELMDWVDADNANKAFFDEMGRLWSMSLEYKEEPFSTHTQTAWAAFEKKFEQRFPASSSVPLAEKEQPEAKVAKMRPMRMALQYAAAIVLLLAAGYWFFYTDGNASTQMAGFTTGPDENRELVLPDGSSVVLNQNSEIAYVESFEKRQVKLSGEAFFQVTKLDGQTFTINAEGATTTVLGTSFNVRAYPSEAKVEVSVTTGKVALQKAEEGNQPLILEAGKAGVFDKEKHTVGETLISNADSWKTSQLDFDSIPLGAVVDALERYFNTDIEIANAKLANCSFKGEFVQPELEEVLDALAFTMMLEVEKQNGTYVLRGDATLCD